MKLFCQQGCNTKALWNVFLRYLLVGGIGFFVDFGILMLCFRIFGIYYLISSAFGFVAGLLVVYIASNAWIFERRKIGSKPAIEFIIFTFIGIIGLLLTQLLMWLFVGQCLISVEISKCLTTSVVLIWNFGARKYILY